MLVTPRTVDSTCTHARPIDEQLASEKKGRPRQRNHHNNIQRRHNLLNTSLRVLQLQGMAPNIEPLEQTKLNFSSPPSRAAGTETYRSTADATNQLHRFSPSTGIYGAESDPRPATSFFSSANIRRSARCPLISGMRTSGLPV